MNKLLLALVILGMSFLVQKEHVMKGVDSVISIQDEMKAPAVKKIVKPEKQLSEEVYPAPEESWPYVPPPDYSHETALPTWFTLVFRTPTPVPTPTSTSTPAPTMNPEG